MNLNLNLRYCRSGTLGSLWLLLFLVLFNHSASAQVPGGTVVVQPGGSFTKTVNGATASPYITTYLLVCGGTVQDQNTTGDFTIPANFTPVPSVCQLHAINHDPATYTPSATNSSYVAPVVGTDCAELVSRDVQIINCVDACLNEPIIATVSGANPVGFGLAYFLVCADVVEETTVDGTFSDPATLGLTPVSDCSVYAVNYETGTILPAVGAIYSTFDWLGACYSELSRPVCINPLPVVTDDAVSACDEGAGTATFDLTDAAVSVTTETGVDLTYFSDAALTIPITDETAWVAADGDIAYVNVTFTATGCDAVAEVTATVNPLPPLEVQDISNSCPVATADLTTAITSNTTDLTPSYFESDGTTAVATPSAVTTAGTYVVRVTDAITTCSASATVVVTITPCACTPANICEGDAFGLQTVNNVNNTAGYSVALVLVCNDAFVSITNAAATTVDATAGVSAGTVTDVAPTPGSCSIWAINYQGTGLAAGDITVAADNQITVTGFTCESKIEKCYTIDPKIAKPTVANDQVCLNDAVTITPIAPPVSVPYISAILANQSTTNDANGDGTANFCDEYVEITGTSANCDISGFRLTDNTGTRHTFPAGSIVPANGKLVVFNGNAPASTATTIYQNMSTTPSCGTGVWNNSGGDAATLLDGAKVISTVSYPGAPPVGTPLTSAGPTTVPALFTFYSDAALNTAVATDVTDLTIDETSTPINTATAGPIDLWVVVSNGCCDGDTAKLTITVNPLPAATTAALAVCDDNADGLAAFTLTNADATVLGAQLPADFTVSYHLNQADANVDASPLGSSYANTTANSQTIYARVEDNTTGCYATAAVTLTVNPLPTATAAITPATCNGAIANSNGTITLSGFAPTERYAFVQASTYTGTATYATATAIPVGGVITSTLANPAANTDYTVRIFTSNGCFIDRTVTLTPTACSASCPPIAAFNGSATICSGGLGTLISAWQTDVAITNAAAIADANTGAISYSSQLINGTTVTTPNGTNINGVHSNPSTCAPENQMRYAYLQCYGANGVAGGGDDSYLLLGTYTLTVNPPVQTTLTNVTTSACAVTITPACAGETFGAISDLTGGANAANWDAATGTYTSNEGDIAGTFNVVVTGVGGSCTTTLTISTPACSCSATYPVCAGNTLPLLTTPPTDADPADNVAVGTVNTTAPYQVDFVLICNSAALPAEIITDAAVGTPDATNGTASATLAHTFTSSDNCVLYAVNYDSSTGTPDYAGGASNSLVQTNQSVVCIEKVAACIQIIPTPTADAPIAVTECDSYTLPALTVGNYFTGPGGTGTALSAGAVITSTQTIYVYAATGTTPNCTDENSFVVTINTTPTADSPVAVTECDSYTLPALTVGNYFTGPGGTGTALSAGDAITTTQTIYVYAATGTTPNCTDENSFVVTINATPSADAPVAVTACDSYTLPALTVGNYFTGTGGTGTALSAGAVITSTQTIYVYAATGTTPNCTDENSFVVTINTTPTFTVATDCNGTNGTITVTTTSIGTYEYSFNGGAFTTSAVSGPYAAGSTVNIVVRDVNTLCSTSLLGYPVNCTCPAYDPTVTATLNGNPVTLGTLAQGICSSDDVVFTVTDPDLQGNEQVLSYSWSGGATGSGNTISLPNINNDLTLILTITYTNGCTVVKQATIKVNPLPLANVATSCTGANTTISVITNGNNTVTVQNALGNTVGTITLTGPDGLGNFAGSLSSGLLPNTTYTVVVVTPGTTCSVSYNITTGTACCPGNPTLANSGPVCAGSPVTLTATLPVGATATSYAWSGPAGSATTTNGSVTIPNMTPAKAGVYNVTVTYSNGCTGVASTNVAVNPKPTITSATASCVNGSGRITVVATIAAPGSIATYVLSNGNTSANGIFNGLSAGTYTVTVTSAAGCTKTTTVTVGNCGCPTPVASNNGPVCAGSALSLSVNPNLPTGVTATYAWSGPAGSSTQQNPTIPNMTPAKAGTYCVTVTYSNGCTGVACTTAALSPAPVVTISGPASFCAGSSATLTANGGASYAWSNGFNTAATNVTTAGTYTVTVTSAAGCTKTATKSVTVTALPALSANVNCTTNGATVTISGSATSYTLNGVTQNSNVFTGVANGTYTVSATNAAGCVGTTSVTVNCNTCAAEVGDVAVNDVVCPGDPFVVTPNFNSPAVGYANYILVANAAGVIVEVAPATSGVTQTLSTSTAGTYNVYAYSVQVPNGGTIPSVGTNVSAISGNCFDLSNPPYEVVLPESPLLLVGLQNSDEGFEGGVTPFHYNTDTIVLSGGIAPYNFDWEIIGYVRYDITYTATGAEIVIYYSDDAQWNTTVTDSYSCASDSLHFTNMQGSVGNTILDIDAYVVTPSSDYTSPDGTITLTVSGGNTSCGTYTYEWSGPDTWTPSFPTTGTAPATGGNQYVLTGLPMGWYSVTVTDCIGNITEGWYWVQSGHRGRTKVEAGIMMSIQPNPFSEVTSVQFGTATSGNATVVAYTVDGKQIATLYNGEVKAGQTYQVPFTGSSLPSGMYLIQIVTNNGEIRTEKVMIAH